MTIHLRQQHNQNHHETGLLLFSNKDHRHGDNDDDSSSSRRPLIVLPVVFLIAFFVVQFQYASTAKEIKQDNKLKFETMTAATSKSTTRTVDSDTTTFASATESNNDATTATATLSTKEEKETNIPKRDPSCTLDCTDLFHKRVDQFSGDLSKSQTMLELATQAYEQMKSKLQEQYGSYGEKIFTGNGFQPFSDLSAKRLQRKLQIKALQVQMAFQKEESSCKQDCQVLLNPNPSPIFQSTKPYYQRYVWATGGHSSSAAHGNLFHESYTAILESDLQPIFAAIGIEFEGRNFAMGGTRSGLEVGLCFEQVFGSDVDFFSWDYGMTDGRKDSLLFHYGYRGALSPGRPAMLGVWTNGWRGREARLQDLEQIGLATFRRTKQQIDDMNAAFPDSGELSEAQVQELPDMVRNFKCQGQIEKGDPHCNDEKYSKGICDNRSAKAGWHPGFKQHALDGHMLAIFLADQLIQALQALVDHSNQDAESLLQQLLTEEDALMNQIRGTKLEDHAWKIYDGGSKTAKLEDLDSDVDLELLYKGNSICHTARLPAITRYMGYLTNTDKIGGVASYQKEEYDTGIEKRTADETEANGQMRLVWEFNAKERQECEVTLRPDHKDFFYTNHKDGLVKLNFPNEKEKAAYKYKQSEMKGVIIFVLNECDWGKCKDGDLKLKDIEQGSVKIQINGVHVTKVVNVGSGCLILKHQNGIQWEPSQKNDYEIAVEVMVPDSYLRISSIVIY